MTGESALDTALVPKNKTFRECLGRSPLARIAAVGLLAMGLTVVIDTYDAPPAQATTFANDYPDASMPCEHANAQGQYLATGPCMNYDWGPTHTTTLGDPSTNSSRGYGYRNCVDGVAWWLDHNGVGVIPKTWGSAVTWDDRAPSSQVIDGTTLTNIEPGDVAQSDDGGSGYGHVGFVTDVTKDANGVVVSFKTAEMNAAGTGLATTGNNYGTRNSLGKFDRGSGYDWDHFIDINGPNKGLDNGSLGGGGQTMQGGFTGDWNHDGSTTVAGAKNDAGAMQWYLSDSNSGANANNIFHFGSPGDMQVSGDWNGDGYTSVGIVRNIGGVLHWYLTNYNQESAPVNYSFDYGGTGDIPVVGDWNHSGHAEPGVVTPSSSGLLWKLKASLAGGSPDYIFYYGVNGDTPVTGDWNGDGYTTPGIARSDGTNLQWYLSDSNSGVNANNIFYFGSNGDIPVTGDWNNDAHTTVGIVRKDGTGPRWFMTNYNQANAPINYGPFYFGSNDMTP